MNETYLTNQRSIDPPIEISTLSSCKISDLQTIANWVCNKSENVMIAVEHDIVHKLFVMIQAKSNDDSVLKYTLVILDKIASQPRGHEALSESKIISFIIKTILIPHHNNISTEIQTNFISLIENMMANMFGYSSHHRNKDLYLRNGLLKYIIPLCSANRYGFRITKVLSQLFATICQKSYISTLRSKYYKKILHGLSLLLMFDDEYVLSEVLPAYLSIFTIGGTFAGHQIILDESAKPKEIINGFRQRTQTDRIIFSKTMTAFISQSDIGYVPDDVTKIVARYFYVFDDDTIKKVHGNTLRRFVDLCGYDDCYIQSNALRIVNGLLLKHSRYESGDRTDKLFEFGLRKQLMLCAESDNESVKNSAWCIMFSIAWDRMDMITSTPLAAAFLMSGVSLFSEYAEKMIGAHNILLVAHNRTPIEHVIVMVMSSIEYVLKSDLLTKKLVASAQKIILNFVNIDRDLMTGQLLHQIDSMRSRFEQNRTLEKHGDFLTKLQRIIEVPDSIII